MTQPHDGDEGYSLVVPFLTDDPAFAHGVEVGMLYKQMEQSDHLADYLLIGNQEQVTLMANRLGWHIVEMKDGPEGWFWCEMRRGA